MTGGSGGAGAILSSSHFPTAGTNLTAPLQMVLRLSPLHFCLVLKEKKTTATSEIELFILWFAMRIKACLLTRVFGGEGNGKRSSHVCGH